MFDIKFPRVIRVKVEVSDPSTAELQTQLTELIMLLSDAFDQIKNHQEKLNKALGEITELVASLRAQIEALGNATPTPESPKLSEEQKVILENIKNLAQRLDDVVPDVVEIPEVDPEPDVDQPHPDHALPGDLPAEGELPHPDHTLPGDLGEGEEPPRPTQLPA